MSIGISVIWNPWPRIWRAGTRQDCIAITRAIYELAGGAPMIDLGAGEGPLTDGFQGVWIDDNPSVVPLQPGGLVIRADIRNAHRIPEVATKRFNLLILTDVMEHLKKEDGVELLKNMDSLVGGCLIFSPTGPLWITKDDDGNPHSHRSSMEPEMFWANGFEVLEWPTFHRWAPDDDHHPNLIRGAFFAWKIKTGTPTAKDVCLRCGIKIDDNAAER